MDFGCFRFIVVVLQFQSLFDSILVTYEIPGWYSTCLVVLHVVAKLGNDCTSFSTGRLKFSV